MIRCVICTGKLADKLPV